ncbi:transposase (plasmid) [Scytonema sp. HK-05]|uniref:helix-turn-helix domain-containing protein n=1 Tax=Scytonema sp. HK-05 TaxID=1137095 RepID=UPI000B1DA20B|nr:helix-turn-helix domain-containing protein [Scytonema sp. HK-05]BAY48921.1 transposase [Scytonema sp. HK-05]BAY49880.1 transposase [Scytonema sp. HK-05]BAY50164.1 transposase [Scytonema sp. HK-05]
MPQPVAIAIRLSSQQKRLLERIVRARTNPYRLVQRAQLILWAAQGMTNTEMASSLRLTRGQVRLWRTRWENAAQKFEQGESEGISDENLLTQIISMLSDQPRRGNPGKFSLEEIVQIIAVACEIPVTSGRPVSHWTPRELADEVIKRKIVPEISPRSVGRFLKSSNVATTSKSLLVKCKSWRSKSV